jgi:hypothetical protein
MDGQIVAFARFASKLQNQRIIFLSIVDTLFEFGYLLRIGLGFKVYIQGIGRILISRSGGHCWRRGQLRNVRRGYPLLAHRVGALERAQH